MPGLEISDLPDTPNYSITVNPVTYKNKHFLGMISSIMSSMFTSSIFIPKTKCLMQVSACLLATYEM